jgi:tRNA A-37 threonylcarbamoyl transferase component Bud32
MASAGNGHADHLEPLDPFDDYDQEILLQSASSCAAKNGSDTAKPWRYVGTSERVTMVKIIAVAAVAVPLAWSQAYHVAEGLVFIISKILLLASQIVIGVLGWSLILYPVAIIIVLSLIRQWLTRFSQANKLDLRQDGLAIGWTSWLMRWPWAEEIRLPWTEITSVFLIRPSYTMLPQRWLVGFGNATNFPVSVRLPVAVAVGVPLYELLKTHCRWVSIDPDLIEAFEPALADDSHTELWLKSLSKAPKESELMPLFPGSVLRDGRYLILNRIGVGGQGTAYLARDNQLDREVVIKENLFPVFVDADVRADAERRFSQEVELLGRLNHDHIVRMLDSFVADHRGYLVLDYIDGVSLRQLVKSEGALPETQVREQAMQMCGILEYLHGLSPPVVHRDFTPENLMLSKSGQIVLIDFNVARQLESTKTATVVGKHAYIPPEQFRGDADTQSDIYAFGATLHFLLTGFDPEPISRSFPMQVNSAVSPSMNALVAKATAENKEERFQTAREILNELQNSHP